MFKEKNLLLQETDIQVKNTFKENLKKHQQDVLDVTEDIQKIKKEKQRHIDRFIKTAVVLDGRDEHSSVELRQFRKN